MKEFSDWITDKYREWRGDAVGRERNISDFADYIGVRQSVISSWMKRGGKVPRHKETIDKLVAVFGLEVYDALGMARPDDPYYSDLDYEDQVKVRQYIKELRDAKRRGAIT